MGIFDDVVGKILGSKTGAESSGLLDGVMDLLSDKEGGGLSGLVQSFQQKGLGDTISSWIGTGQNWSISPEQIEEGLGSERIQNLAAKAGMSTEEVTAKLSELLPTMIDKITPDGLVPEGGLLDKGLEFLKSKLS
ncbi:YidB family protein [Geoanaerobacter pelophilus]|uniref:YidB family protein n=1 Tax=Geoanaerobacter pelophilus TaxID=60036 RepID=UPI000A267D94|nr:YidB family protein [Geoanaerobacter pelophilus]